MRMKIRKTAVMLAACMGMTLLAGCDSEQQKTFNEAAKDLEQGSYEYALDEFTQSVNNGISLAVSYRGIGICQMRLGNYEDAISAFTSALGSEKVSKTMAKDLYLYRATARLQAGLLDDAMADCQTLAQKYEMDADCWFLSGKVALAMDGYDEASSDFEQAYGEDSSYDRAIQIYETYLEKDMEADGTRYLEAALSSEAKDTDDMCDRGRIYCYMEDYGNAKTELTNASSKGSTEAVLLLGMVYGAQQDYVNARAMYQQYINKMQDNTEKNSTKTAASGYNGLAVCDIAEGNYDSALENINSGIAAASDNEMQSLLFNEIVVYEKKLDFSTAQEKAQSYVGMYPEDEEAAHELAFLKSRTGAGE